MPAKRSSTRPAGALLPGLHDHHVHLRALAAAAASVQVGPPQVRTGAELAARLRAADADLPAGRVAALPSATTSRSPGRWTAMLLDRIARPTRPVRVQHRTGALWVVNSLAAARLGLDECELGGVERDDDGRPTGRLWRMDRWLADRVPPAMPPRPGRGERAGAVARRSPASPTRPPARPGVTSPSWRTRGDGRSRSALHCMAPPGVSPADRRTVSIGPVKIMLDDTTLPSLDELADLIRGAHAAGRPAAVHCVTRVQLVLTLAALDLAGRAPGDRIEHGAVIPAEFPADLRGLTVVTQPHFVAERGEQYAADVAAGGPA